MSLDTYANLKTAILDMIKRPELTTFVVDAINLTESRINRKLRLLKQETLDTTTYDPASASRYLTFPTGMTELLELKIKTQGDDDSTYINLTYLPTDRIQEKYSGTAGKPQFYTIRNQFEFERLPDVIYTIQQHYLKNWDIATDSTNWLLTNHPDVYFYGSLVAMELYVQNDPRLPTWKSLWDEAMQELDDLDQRMRDDETLSVSDLASMDSSYRNFYNIIRDL